MYLQKHDKGWSPQSPPSHISKMPPEIEGRSCLITRVVVQLLNSMSLLQVKDNYRNVFWQKIKIPTLVTWQLNGHYVRYPECGIKEKYLFIYYLLQFNGKHYNDKNEK